MINSPLHFADTTSTICIQHHLGGTGRRGLLGFFQTTIIPVTKNKTSLYLRALRHEKSGIMPAAKISTPKGGVF